MKNNQKSTNRFDPKIVDNSAIKDFASQNKKRLLISACDIEYLEKNFECLIAYKNSNSNIPYLVLIFKDKTLEEDGLRKQIAILKAKIDCDKISFGVFTCDALAEIESDLGIASYKLYRTYYIRCARFLMVKKIWQMINIDLLNVK